MKELECKGTAYELGLQHGQGATEEVKGSVEFYKQYFVKSSKMEWDEVISVVDDFLPFLKSKCPELLEEMKGVADGAGIPYRDIIALNIRTEIAFGLFKPEKEMDGCTSLAYYPRTDAKEHVLLGQNWDWYHGQREKLVVLSLIPTDGRPKMKFVTEGGIIGKIGFNELGVGVCINAIRAKGLAVDRWPMHLAIRKVLQCKTGQEALTELKTTGVASAIHILVAAPDVAQSMEFSSIEFQTIDPNEKGYLAHSNHYLVSHPGVYEPFWLDDSPLRYKRAVELSQTVDLSKGFTEFVEKVFTDQTGSPRAICRTDWSEDGSITIFSIAMDLTAKKAVVYIGGAVSPLKIVDLSF